MEKPSETLRGIDFIDDKRSFSHEGLRPWEIKVIAGTYGRSCGVPYGNATNHLADACNGRSTCEYTVDVRILGDPARECAKDYVAE